MPEKLKVEVHRLAGSAGSYGFKELSSTALLLEVSLKSDTGSPMPRRNIGQQISDLLQALDTAARKKT